MRNRWRHTTAYAVIVVYIMAGALLEIAHHDLFDGTLQSRPVLTSHKCGTNEIHVPIDQRRYCLACVQSAQRVSTQAPGSLSIGTSLVYIASFPSYSEQLLIPDILHSGKRGPPVTA